MITINIKATLTDEQALDMAINDFSWTPTVKKEVEKEYGSTAIEEVENPITKEQAIQGAIKDIVDKIFEPSLARQKEIATAQIKATLEATEQAVDAQFEAQKEQSIEVTVE